MTICKYWIRILAALLAFAMFAAACGSSDDDSTAGGDSIADSSDSGTDASDSGTDASDSGTDSSDSDDDDTAVTDDGDDSATTDDAVEDDPAPSGGVLTIDIDSRSSGEPQQLQPVHDPEGSRYGRCARGAAVPPEPHHG